MAEQEIISAECTEMQPYGRHIPVSQEQMQCTIDQINLVRTFIYSELRDGTDYGKVSGCGDKPTLLQPGAQKICMFFNVYPDYDVQRLDKGGEHVEYIIKTSLVSRTTGLKVCSGVGSCTTLEKKYRYRRQERVCPKCGADTIRQSKTGGFFCGVRAGGCGASFAAGDPSIVNQKVGRVENEDLADTYNTVLKMGKKRSFVDATLSLSCISDYFTQDLEERGEVQPAGGLRQHGSAKVDTNADRNHLLEQHIDRLYRLARQQGKQIGLAPFRTDMMAVWTQCCKSAGLKTAVADKLTGPEFAGAFAAFQQTTEAEAGDPPAPEDVPAIDPEDSSAAIRASLDWRDHPQVIEYNRLFEQLVEESGTLDGEREPAFRAFVKNEWVKVTRERKLEARPDRIVEAEFAGAAEAWQKRIREAIRNRPTATKSRTTSKRKPAS